MASAVQEAAGWLPRASTSRAVGLQEVAGGMRPGETAMLQLGEEKQWETSRKYFQTRII